MKLIKKSISPETVKYSFCFAKKSVRKKLGHGKAVFAVAAEFYQTIPSFAGNAFPGEREIDKTKGKISRAVILRCNAGIVAQNMQSSNRYALFVANFCFAVQRECSPRGGITAMTCIYNCRNV